MRINLFQIAVHKWYFTIAYYPWSPWRDSGLRYLGPGRKALDIWKISFLFEEYA